MEKSSKEDVCVDILLATYNGELYIEQQILSLISQTYKKWKLYIHDDGSIDHTIKIIKKIQQYDNRISLIEDGIQYKNAPANFLSLLKYSTSDFLMFCDQDDIWFDNKIEVMLEAIRKRNNNIPVVVYSNAYVWEPNGRGVIGNATLTFPKSIRQFLFLNSGVQGCVAIFNKKMKILLMMWEGKCAMHDHLLHLLGLTMGEVEYLPASLMLYRQHVQSVTGNATVCKNDIRRILGNKNICVVDRLHYETVNLFLSIYNSYLQKSDKSYIVKYLQLPSFSKLMQMLNILYYRFELYNSVMRLVIKVIIRSYICGDNNEKYTK